MLAIKVNTEFIDLPADVSLELERNNPFLSDDDIQGEFSLGLTIRYTEKNYRLLQYAGNFYKGNQKYTVDAEIYDAAMFRYAGKLVITQHQSNMNNIEETVWTGFFTIGSASFLQSIQDVLLSDIDLGGVRSFNWTTPDKDGSNGFWQHLYAARTPNAFDYTFYPISNNGWTNDLLSIEGMNMMDGNNDYQIINNAIAVCPCIYLSFVLQSIFKNYGWKLQGEILQDVGFQKITIPSFQAIKWCNYVRTGVIMSVTPLPVITFDLADHVPQSITIGSFLVSVKNRMGWYFDFDSNTKTATLRANKTLIDSPVKDWTKYVMSSYNADYADLPKVYELVNNIDSNDDYPITKNVPEDGLIRVANISDLPAPSSSNDGSYAFVFLENNYYQCQSDDSGVLSWQFYAHNIGDYSPENKDTTIESDISTMPTVLHQWRGSDKILLPTCLQPGNFFKSKNGTQDFAVRFLFYHGMFPDTGGISYPFASCINQAISGTPTGAWVLPYRHEFGAVNDGTYDYWWKAWLKLLSIQDMRTFTLALPVNELRNFSFSDIIFIHNVFFIVQSAKETLPYKDLIEMKMKRIY